MKNRILSTLVFVAMLVCLAGCDDPFLAPAHVESLASGAAVHITSFNLVWGSEHDDHALGQDCFAIEYVTAYPDDDTPRRDAEAAEVFELVRRVSEQWGFREATVAAIPTLRHRGLHDLYWYRRQPDGHWSFTVVARSGAWIPGALSAPPR